MNFEEYQGLLTQYMQDHPYVTKYVDMSLPLTDRAGDPNAVENEGLANKQYHDWRNTLTPNQLQEYDTAQHENYAKGVKMQRLVFGGALAGMGGLGLLAANGGSLPAFAGNALGSSLGGSEIAGTAGAMAGGLGEGVAPAFMGAGSIGAGAGTDAILGGGLGMDLGSLFGSGGIGGSLLNVGGNLVSGLLGSSAAKKASQAQIDAGNQSNELARYIYDQSRSDAAPYRQAGVSALEGIQRLLSNPNSLTEQPDYQFGFNEGTKALNQGAASRGMTYSGAQGKALQRYGNDYAGTKLNESYNRLASLAGIGQQANTVGAATGQNYANNVGQTMQGMGNAQGSGYMGSANSWGNAIGNSLNNYQQNEMLNLLMNRGK
jgi:hypothetical protein